MVGKISLKLCPAPPLLVEASYMIYFFDKLGTDGTKKKIKVTLCSLKHFFSDLQIFFI